MGSSTRTAGSASVRAARRTTEVSTRVGRSTRRTVRRATNAQGAGETGMAKLTELSGVNAAADAMVAVALAGTLFFSVPVGEARGRVALYLLVTMAPFALLAPLVGPMLDRFRAGRRYALAITFAVRAFLAWQMAGSVGAGDLWLYPAAFGVLVASRAYGVSRAAVTPRLLPPSMPLVRANSWMSMCGLVSAAIAAGVGAGIGLFGNPWTLRASAVVFAVGAVLSLRLPARVDASAAERTADLSAGTPAPGAGSPPAGPPATPAPRTPDDQIADDPIPDERIPDGPIPDGPIPDGVATSPESRPAEVGLRRGGRRPRQVWARVRSGPVGPAVRAGLRANAGFRALAGFLTLFLAFLLREDPIGGISDVAAIAMVIAAVGLGSATGSGVGGVLRERAPEGIMLGLLLTQSAVIVATAIWWGLPTVLAAGFIAGFGQTLGKLALDALIQRDVAEDVRSSAFARSETWLQMSWVFGGGFGVALPLRGDVGFGIAAVALVTLTVVTLHRTASTRRRAVGRAQGSRSSATARNTAATLRASPAEGWRPRR